MPLNPRSHMEAVIRNGVGVMLPGGQVVTRIEDLPSEADLALMDRKIADRSAERADSAAKKIADDPKSTRDELARAEAHRKAADAAKAEADRRRDEAIVALQAQIERQNADLVALRSGQAPPVPADPEPAKQSPPSPPKVGPAPVEPSKPAPVMTTATHPVARPIDPPKAPEKAK